MRYQHIRFVKTFVPTVSSINIANIYKSSALNAFGDTSEMKANNVMIDCRLEALAAVVRSTYSYCIIPTVSFNRQHDWTDSMVAHIRSRSFDFPTVFFFF